MLVVVIILALLATLIRIVAAWAVGDSAGAVFVTNMNTFRRAAELHHAQHGRYPEESAPGIAEGTWADCVSETLWSSPTPHGGSWHLRGDPPAVGVHYDASEFNENDNVLRYTQILDDMQRYDDAYDDGALDSGRFQQIDGNGFYHVLAD